MESIKVLDHGFVRLVDHMGNDLSVVRAARVSYDAAWRAGTDQGSDAKLIKYLWNNGHTTPFESVTFTFEVKAPIFIFRQWHRHRMFSFNELSARYKELPTEYYVPDVDTIGEQSTSSKQARVLTDKNNDLAAEYIKNSCEISFMYYNKLLKEGVPRELARSVLPVATYSHMFATVDMLNLFKFLALRLDKHAQWEIQQYAKALLELITPIVPVCVDVFKSKLA